MLAAANRDAERFADPDRLDVARAGSDHLGFGAGPHRCAGAPLVASLLRVATRTLLDTFPVIELADAAECVEWVGGLATCAPRELPVILHSGSSGAPG
jgi:cytochrome P450